MESHPIAVIGAGLAGLACARALIAAGRRVTLFDKGRAPGGRLATRRAEAAGRALQFDHGAQYLTARGPRFAAVLADAGVQVWPEAGRFVATPGMSALPRGMAAGLDLRLGQAVDGLQRDDGAWWVQVGEAPAGPFAALALTIPAPQAAALLGADKLAATLAPVRLEPCWTVLAAFPARLDLPDTLRPDTGPIGWAARDSAKPGRDPAAECWVIQARPDWSAAQLEDPGPAVIAPLLAALGAGATPDYAVAHRWRYAAVARPLGAPCLWDAARRIGLAGDWCLAARAEAAFDSGEALAAAIAA